VVGSVAVLALRRSPDDRFREYVAAMRASNEPTTVEELCGRMPLDAENAAPEIAAALSWVDVTLGPEETWPPGMTWRDPLGDARVPLERFVGQLSPFAVRVSAALDRPRCRFSSPEVALADQIPALDRLARTERLLRATTRFAHDPDAQVDASRSLARLAVLLEPITQVERDRTFLLMRDSVEDLRAAIESGTWDASSVRSRVDQVLAVQWLPRVSALATQLRIEVLRWHQQELDADANLGPVDSIEKRWRAIRGRETWRESQRPTADSVVREAEDLREVVRGPTSSYLLHLAAMGRSVPSPESPDHYWVHRIGDPYAQVDAQTRLARIALAAAEHRATHGDFPASLDELRPMFPDGVPIDPYTDAPFVYGKIATGVRIASAGRLAEDAALDEVTLRERCLVWELRK
jgi:hypothetical protein